MPTSGSYDPIRPIDLKDPTLTKLNKQFQLLFAAVGLTGSSATAQQQYVPAITGAGLTLTALGTKRAQFHQTGATVDLSLDVDFSIAGAGNSLALTLPSLPDSYTAATAFSCTIINGGNTTSGVAILSNASIVVRLSSGANFATGATEIILAGSYQAATS